MNGSLLRQLARFSSRYEAYLVSEKRALGLPSWEALRTDWWLGLRFFLNRAFMQGRRDSVSVAFLEATNTALAGLLPPNLGSHKRASRVLEWSAAGWFRPANWSDQDNPVRHALDRTYAIQVNGQTQTSGTGKARDREMVLDTLRFICEHPSAGGQILNIATYSAERIEAGQTSVVYRELDGIRQVGPKIAAFFLRDLVATLELQSLLNPADYCLLQPVDTWVEKIADKLDIKANQHGLPAALADACQREGVDPIRFNQGAWYLGAHSFNLLLENLERIEP